MPEEENNITCDCKISNRVISKNGVDLFTRQDGNLNDFLISAYEHFRLNYPKFYKMDNLCRLGLLAAEILLRDSFKKENYRPEEVGIVLANSHSSLDTDLKYYETTRGFASPSLFVYTLPNIVMGEICIRHKFKGENALFIQRKFNPEFIQEYVRDLLNNNILQACICGWVDLFAERHEAILYLIEKGSADLSREQKLNPK